MMIRSVIKRDFVLGALAGALITGAIASANLAPAVADTTPTSAQMEALAKRLDVLEKRGFSAQSLPAQPGPLEVRMAHVESTVANHSSRLTALDTAVAKVQQTAGTVSGASKNSQIDDLTTAYNTLQASVSTEQQVLGVLTSTVGSDHDQLFALSTNYNALAGTVAQQETTLGTMDADTRTTFVDLHMDTAFLFCTTPDGYALRDSFKYPSYGNQDPALWQC